MHSRLNGCENEMQLGITIDKNLCRRSKFLRGQTANQQYEWCSTCHHLRRIVESGQQRAEPWYLRR